MKKEIIKQLELENGKIPTKLAVEWITRNERILIDSPPNSGKTTSILNAFEKLSDKTKDEFFILTTPTRFIGSQSYQKHANSSLLVQGGNNHLKTEITHHLAEGNRIFICTYDKLPFLIETLKAERPAMIYHLVIDEFHRLILDYKTDFRYQTISNMYSIQKTAKSMIALSGTTSEIPKGEFTTIITVEKPDSPHFKNLVAVSYPLELDAVNAIVNYVLTRLPQHKLLIYCQSIDVNEQVALLLNKLNIKTAVIDSEKKKMPAYKTIEDKRLYPENYDVILATSVIAEGVSLENVSNGLFETVVVVNHNSRLFNLTTVEQMSHRFRQQFEQFTILYQKCEVDEEIHNTQKIYDLLLNTTTHLVTLLNADIGYFHPETLSILEQNNFLTIENNQLKVDKFSICNKLITVKEYAYERKRNSFICDVASLFTHNELTYLSYDWTDTYNHLLEVSEEELKSIPLQQRLSPEKYKELTTKIDSGDKIHTKSILTKPEAKALHKIGPYIAYDEFLKIVPPLDSTQKVNLLDTKLDGFVQLLLWDVTKQVLPTKVAIQKLEQHCNVTLSKDKYNETLNKICSELKFTNYYDLNQTVKKHFILEFKSKKIARYRTIKQLTPTNLATFSNLELHELYNLLKMLIQKKYTKNKTALLVQLEIAFFASAA